MSWVDKITLWVFIGFWPLWFIWEMALLIMRGTPGGEFPETISMVARDRGWHMAAIVYLWGGLATHYWWPTNTWATVPGSIIFWGIALLLLVQDVVLWNSDVSTWAKWLLWQRWPLMWLFVGLLSGRFLFPQRGQFPWS